jgi:hypothetical protein
LSDFRNFVATIPIKKVAYFEKTVYGSWFW